MNKKTLSIILGLFVALSFISCGNKKSAVDEFGFYNDMDAAVATAKKEHKNILLYVTMEGFDSQSGTFISDVLHSSEYKSLFGKNFVSVHFDFGANAYQKTDMSNASNEEEQKKIEKYNMQLAKNLTLARSLNMQYSPAMFIMSEDGYAFSDEVYNEADEETVKNFSSVQNLRTLMNNYESDFDVIKELVSATKKGSAVERVNAIEDLYQTVDDKYVPTMKELFKSVPEIDKKNESGKVSPLYCIYLFTELTNFTMINDFSSAVILCRQAVNTGYLEGEELQQVYFLMSQMLIQIGSDDYAEILGCLTKSIDAAPESQLSGELRIMLEQMTEIINSQGGLEAPEGN